MKQDTRLNSLEGGANTYLDKAVTLEEQVTRLSSDVVKLTSKVEDLENRQCRGNSRIFGVREGLETVGGSWPTLFIVKLLQEILGIDYSPTLDRALKNGEPPRPIIVKFHYLQEKVNILCKAYRPAPSPTTARRFAFTQTTQRQS